MKNGKTDESVNNVTINVPESTDTTGTKKGGAKQTSTDLVTSSDIEKMLYDAANGIFNSPDVQREFVLSCYKIAWKNVSVKFSQTERDLFLEKVTKRKECTKGFTIQFQSEQTEETIGTCASGLTFFKNALPTIAGVRTSFNSYDVFRTEVQRKQANDNFNNALALLSEKLGGVELTPEMLKACGFVRVAATK